MEQAYARLESNLDRVFSSKRLQAFRDQLFYLGMDINSIVTNIQAKLKTDAKNLQKVQVEMIKTVWEFQNQSWVMESQGFTLEGISKAIEANIGIMSSLQNDARFKTDATLQELFKSYDNFVQKLYDLKDQMQQFITGTTQENIADSIVQGFIEGKKSMVDFTEDFKTLMQNAVVAAFKNRILNEKLDAFYNEFAKVAGDYDGLTAAEISTLQGVYSKIIEEAGVAYDYFQRISGVTLGSQNTEEDALTGRIKGITEEQADLLGGILLSMREYVMRMASYQGANGAAVNSQLVSIDTSSKLIYQELINMNQINMTDLIRHNRTIAENTSFNKILPDIKNELVNLNLYIKNL